MVTTRKFSEFVDGGTLVEGEQTVGLSGGTNAKFTAPPQFLAAGTTAERPSPATEGMIRYNTDLATYEYYDGSTWQQFEASGDISALIAQLASNTAGEGASMIGLEDQGAVSGQTVQDLAEADILVKTNTSALVNGFAIGTLNTGFMSVTTGTGDLISREITGTANQIDLANGTGLSGNPQISISANPQLPGNEAVVIPSGTTAQRPGSPTNGYIRYNTDDDVLEFYDNNSLIWVQAGSGTTWNEITSTSENMTGNNGYIANNVALVTLTLPSSSNVGEVLYIQGKGAGLFRIAQGAGQLINFGASTTTTGAGGYLEATHRYDSLILVCITANTEWAVLGAPQGTITVV